jgi:predicted  nucleic acid-binding Zn-ribbon protein
VTAQNFMEVMRNDKIRHCPHCQRILFYLRPEAHPAAPAEPESAA